MNRYSNIQRIGGLIELICKSEKRIKGEHVVESERRADERAKDNHGPDRPIDADETNKRKEKYGVGDIDAHSNMPCADKSRHSHDADDVANSYRDRAKRRYLYQM